MPTRSLARVLFLLYCIEAGVLLLLAPWSPSWDHAIIQIPSFQIQSVLADGMMRGAISGFGLVHLVWGAHDLDGWLARRKLDGHSTT